MFYLMFKWRHKYYFPFFLFFLHLFSIYNKQTINIFILNIIKNIFYQQLFITHWYEILQDTNTIFNFDIITQIEWDNYELSAPEL